LWLVTEGPAGVWIVFIILQIIFLQQAWCWKLENITQCQLGNVQSCDMFEPNECKQKYLCIFRLQHLSLDKNCSLLGTDNVRRQISEPNINLVLHTLLTLYHLTSSALLWNNCYAQQQKNNRMIILSNFYCILCHIFTKFVKYGYLISTQAQYLVTSPIK